MSTKHIKKSIDLIQELIDSKNPILYTFIQSKNNTDITDIVAKKYSTEFLKLVEDFGKISTIEQCIQLFDYIGVEPLNFVDKTNRQFRIELLNRPIEQIQDFLNFAKNKIDGKEIKSAFDYIEKTTYNFAFNLLSAWSHEDSKDLDKFKLIWVNENLHLKNKLLENSNLSADNEKTPTEILKDLQKDPQIPNRNWYRIGYHYLDEEDIKNILSFSFYFDLDVELSQNTTKQPKKAKI